MAQRVYLIPLKPDLVSTFIQLIQSPPSREAEIWERIQSYATRQTKLNALSNTFAQGLKRKKFEAAGREEDYYQYTAARPYLITSTTPTEVVQVVKALRTCQNTQEATAIFESQVRALGELWAEPTQAPDPPQSSDDWSALWKNVQQLKLMRSNYHKGQPFSIEVMKAMRMEDYEDEDEPPFAAFSMDETETKEIATTEIPMLYANLLGNTLGRVAGLCEPTWWLGRNYWVGLLCFSRLGLLQKFKYGPLQKSVASSGQNPARLFQEIALPGFESGFDLTCPAYSTGLLLPSENIASLLQSLQQSREQWEQLSSLISGYPREITRNSVALIEEALLWAQSENCSLLEGDELVGSLGFR